ncbi:MAG: hypothetical protein CVU65_04610 [Deltaproteobacteria bacterium HGW-Deltaproteobacteria-22]|nr:MAG: hypothetical protein CVU65_04610 [Deltaproteobacteria bacterium HGW-Deltaproteobacteria-22]
MTVQVAEVSLQLTVLPQVGQGSPAMQVCTTFSAHCWCPAVQAPAQLLVLLTLLVWQFAADTHSESSQSVSPSPSLSRLSLQISMLLLTLLALLTLLVFDLVFPPAQAVPQVITSTRRVIVFAVMSPSSFFRGVAPTRQFFK